ncbi:hypothetical protein [Phycicoccus sp. Soil748]|uniref:hypothetical protein n=1 Tax=Phycicoccus sp. Soil748 TaxID=1736397 RepID=UPI000702F436|nr:hypothetical protein [Phycicoccus sp. Soil748]KRE54546.1 hypothetical protein ASG70_10260 [Phycicoccus sp. Soil748]
MPPPHRPGDADDQAPPTAHLEAALRTVYAAVPDDFMAVRKALVAEAKADGDTRGAAAIGKLRKPSTAAWAVNLLTRGEPGLVEELVDLGVRMRTAQSRLDTATLTSLRPERDRVVAGVVAAAARLVADTGRTLSPAAQDDVRGTVIAALADEQASSAVTSGQLTRALSYSGFGEVDLSEAVVRTSSGSILSVVRGGTRGGPDRAHAPQGPDGAGSGGDDGADGGEDRGEDGATEEEDAAALLAAAEAELEAAVTALSSAQESVAAAREHAEETRERVGVVERQLAKAREADERALEAVTDAVRARKEAEAARRTAEEALTRLRAEAQD